MTCIRQNRLRRHRVLGSVLLLGLLAACSDAGHDADLQRNALPLKVGSAGTCSVELVKVNYDNPGSDNAEYVELQVHSSGTAVTTLGACGLSGIELRDGAAANCGSYRSIPLASTPIPNDRRVVICAKGSGPAQLNLCDVIVDTSGAELIQNGPGDAIIFFGASTGLTIPRPPLMLSTWV